MMHSFLKNNFEDLPAKMLSEEPTVHPTAYVMESELGAWTEVGARTKVVESVMEKFSYVVHDSDIAYAKLGKFCSVASHVRINPGNHPLERAALHHFTYRCSKYAMGDDDESFFDWRRAQEVTLGDDVWVGHGAVILPGVTIDTGAAVAAGAVVSRDVPPFTIVAGVPAKPIRSRFSESVQEGLLNIRWWDWPHEKLMEALPDFRNFDAESFIEKYVQ